MRALLFAVSVVVATGCQLPIGSHDTPPRVKPGNPGSLLGDPCERDSDCRDDSLICRYQTCSPAAQGYR